MQKRRILILGEYGAFGRRISLALSRFPFIDCILGVEEKRKPADLAREINAEIVPVDLANAASLRRALTGVYAVVNTSGPFLGADFIIASVCADLGVHYIDPADSREHVAGITRLARSAENSGCLLVSGAGTAPAVSAALADMLTREFDTVSEIHTALVRGRGDQRELAVMRAILGFSGDAIRLKEKGRWREAYGWAQSKKIDFPKPIGRRRGYLCDTPDLDLFPRRYGAQTVTSRVVLPAGSYNLALSILGWLKRLDLIQNIPRIGVPLIRLGGALFDSGKVRGGLRVEMLGLRHEEPTAHTVYLITRDDNGPAIAAAPTIALIKKWVTHGVQQSGALPCVGLLTWDEIKAELMTYDIVLIRL